MQTSEHINELAEALAKAQGAIGHAAKDSTNPHFKSKYADLSSIRDACSKALADNGIGVLQGPSTGDDGTVCVTTRLVHKSGQWVETTMCCRPVQPTAQAMGSVVTYLRRYSLAAMAGVAPDDDDGTAASEMAPQSPPDARTAPKPPPKAPTQPATNGAAPGCSEAPSRPPVDWEEGDPLSIPDANGDVEVIYTDSRGTEHRLASSKALAKIEAAHKSTISDAALDDLIRVNRAWLATHYGPALKAFEGAPRPWAGR